MINVIFEIPSIKFQSKEITLPGIPRVGDQVFLADFVSEKEEEIIMNADNKIYIDSLIVMHVTWLRGNDKNVYLLISLQV